MTVLDVNDHTPVLSSDFYEFTISEDTSVNSRFPQIVASDNDATTNAQITYSIDLTSEYHITLHCDALNTACIIISLCSSGPFRIDPANGELILMESLDYEAVTNYTFMVTATDGGGLRDNSVVQVTVMDANDNRPRFQQELYTVAVEEGDYSQSSINLLSVSLSLVNISVFVN